MLYGGGKVRTVGKVIWTALIDELTWLLLGNLAADADRCTRWSTALARYAIEQRPGSRDVLQRWITRWAPRTEAAAAGLAG